VVADVHQPPLISRNRTNLLRMHGQNTVLCVRGGVYARCPARVEVKSARRCVRSRRNSDVGVPSCAQAGKHSGGTIFRVIGIRDVPCHRDKGCRVIGIRDVPCHRDKGCSVSSG
jgi:hypothetical protein